MVSYPAEPRIDYSGIARILNALKLSTDSSASIHNSPNRLVAAVAVAVAAAVDRQIVTIRSYRKRDYRTYSNEHTSTIITTRSISTVFDWDELEHSRNAALLAAQRSVVGKDISTR